MNLDINDRVRSAVTAQANQIRKQWLFQKPRLELPNIRRVALNDISAEAFKKQLPGWYKMALVEQNDEWWVGMLKDFTLKILGGVRSWYKNLPLESLTHQYVVKEHFKLERWERANMQWFEWFVFLQDVGKMTTMRIRRGKTVFIGHELAGSALIEKWFTAIEISPSAINYLKNMITVSGLLNFLLQDFELTHKGVLIKLKKNLGEVHKSVYLELILLETATLQVSNLKQTSPSEYQRRMLILQKALSEVLDELAVED
jgi:hypothetical protein